MTESTSTNLLQSSKYKCFWDFLHVETGAQIIASLVLFKCCLSLFDALNQEKCCCDNLLGLQCLNIYFEILPFGTLLLGIMTTNAIWFWSSLFYTAYWGVGYGAGSILCLIAANSKSSLGRLARYILEACFAEVNDNFLLFEIVFCTLKMIIAFFLFDIIYRCFKYVKEKSCQENCTQSDHTLVLQSSFSEIKESSTV